MCPYLLFLQRPQSPLPQKKPLSKLDRMGAKGSKPSSSTPLAKRLQKGAYNVATTLKRGSNSFFAKVRGAFTRKAPNTAHRRAKAQKRVNMLERINKAPKGLNWLRKGYYGVKKMFNKKSMTNRIASAKAKSILARNRAAQVVGLPNTARPLGGMGAFTFAVPKSGSSRSKSGSSRSRSGSGRSRSNSGYPGGSFNWK